MIEDYLNQSATWYPKTDHNIAGESTYGTTSSIDVRIVPKTQVIKTPEGKEVESKAEIFTASAVVAEDKLVFLGVDYIILNWEMYPDLDGDETYRRLYV